MRNMPTASQIDNGLGPRKTVIIMVTLVGCLAILWPKVFYPMMFGSPPKQNIIKEHRGTVPCCDVVIDRVAFMNASGVMGESAYRKRLNLVTGEMSLRQERPPHLRPESVHPAMRERGRAIPQPTVPIVERARAPASPPRIVEGRPGPIPGMRPPMGAGSVHQAQPKSNSMGFIMPLYTVGIVAFFVYTVMRIVFKKRVPNAPYGPARHDPKFRQEVFGHEPVGYRRPDDGTTKLGQRKQQSASNGSIEDTITVNTVNTVHRREQEQLMEIEKLRKKLEETEKAMAKIMAEMGCDPLKAKETNDQNQNGNISNGHAKPFASTETKPDVELDKPMDAKDHSSDLIKKEKEHIEEEENKKDDHAGEKSVQSHEPEEPMPEPTEIYLEGSLPHDSQQILIADTVTRTESAEDINGLDEEPAAVLSSKITLSLINLHTATDSDVAKTGETTSDKDSPIDQDIEIVNGEDEQDKDEKK